MKKKQLKSFQLNKKSISNLKSFTTKGGFTGTICYWTDPELCGYGQTETCHPCNSVYNCDMAPPD